MNMPKFLISSKKNFERPLGSLIMRLSLQYKFLTIKKYTRNWFFGTLINTWTGIETGHTTYTQRLLSKQYIPRTY